MKIVKHFFENERKCGACNWKVSNLYCFEGQNVSEVGMCGDCFCEFLAEQGLEVLNMSSVENLGREKNLFNH